MPTLARVFWPVVITILFVVLASYLQKASASFDIPEYILLWSSKLALSLSWIAGATLFGRLLDIFLWRGLFRNATGREPPRLIVQLISFGIYVASVAGILAFVFDQSVTAFWATSGAVGIVIGLALQSLILDTFSGLAIHLENPFKVGDWINVHTRMGEFIGRVEETNWRTTRLWTTDRNIIIIPNSFLTTTVVVNYSRPGEVARFELEYFFDFHVDSEHVTRVLTSAALNAVGDKGPLAEPAPKVRLDRVTDEGVCYKIRYYLEPGIVSPSKARNTLHNKVLNHLTSSGISLTYPKRDVYVTDMPWRQKGWEHENDIAKQLTRLSLFRELSQDDLSYLTSQLQTHFFRHGQTIVEKGDTSTSMYIVAEGILNVFIDSEENGQLQLATLEPGNFFGEMSLLTGAPRSATIRSDTDVLVGEITKETISNLITRRPQVAVILSTAVARREFENQEALESTLVDQSEIENEAGKILQSIRKFFRL